MILLSKYKVDATTFINDTSIAVKKKIKPTDLSFEKTNIVFNSALTKEVYDKFGIKTGNSFVQYFNFAPYKKEQTPQIEQRKYGLAFIASHFNRTVKNADLAYELFNAFPDEQKFAIGKESERFASIVNTEVNDMMTQADIMHHLADTKVLLVPSYFDSSPSVLSEAILNGCNVLVSKNVGWHEVLDERCVVQDYNNKEEWVSKVQYLLNNKIDYARFEAIVADSTESIISNIDKLVNSPQ
jgi:hypothetical protein